MCCEYVKRNLSVGTNIGPILDLNNFKPFFWGGGGHDDALVQNGRGGGDDALVQNKVDDDDDDGVHLNLGRHGSFICKSTASFTELSLRFNLSKCCNRIITTYQSKGVKIYMFYQFQSGGIYY